MDPRDDSDFLADMGNNQNQNQNYDYYDYGDNSYAPENG